MREIQYCKHGKSWLLGDKMLCKDCGNNAANKEREVSLFALRMGGKSIKGKANAK